MKKTVHNKIAAGKNMKHPALVKKLVLPFLLLALLLIGLAVSLVLVRKSQEIRNFASAGQVALSLTSDKTGVNHGESFTINVLVNPPADQSLKVSAVQSFINYPSDKLVLNSVTPGNFFMRNFTSGQTEMLNIIDIQTPGTAKIFLGAPCTTAAMWQCYTQTQGGYLAALNFTAKTGISGTAQISFDSQNTLVAALDSQGNPVNNNQNVLNTQALNSLSISITPPPPTKAVLNFSVKFQGISSQKPDKTVRVILKQNDTVKYTFNDLAVSADSSGVYSATVTDVDPGTYDIYIKGFSHLQKKFGSITLNAGQNTQDFSTAILKAGDFDTNNFINAVDIGKVIEHYFPNTPANSPVDFNLDGTVNAIDIGFVIENYFLQEE